MRIRGFTLVEVLVSMAIVVGICLLLVAVLRMSRQSWQSAESYLAVSSELRRGLDAMSREVTATESGQLSIAADGNWYAALTFKIPQDLNEDGTVLDAAGILEWSNLIAYSLSGTNGTQVVRSQPGLPDRVLANGVTALQFRRVATTPKVVEILLTVQRGTDTGDFPNQASLSTKVRLRN